MNVPLTELLSEAQGTGVAPKLRVTILHGCLDTGKHAERFTDQMAAGFADERAAKHALDLNLWSFGVLGMREVRNTAVGAAAAADLVILSTSGTRAIENAPVGTPVSISP